MQGIYTFGETVYDIIFDQGNPVAAKAGGAMLNTAVSLGRCGNHVSLITEMGDDQIGHMIMDFLKKNNVNTDYIFPYQKERTPVALAFLDEEKSASYSFYKQYPLQRLNHDFPEPGRGDIVLFGSFYSLSQEIRGKLMGFIKAAKDAGATIIYDPNIRKAHLDELNELFPLVLENISIADIVRGSDEDFENLFNCCESSKVFGQLNELGCQFIIITRGVKGAELLSENINIKVPAKKINITSTIGAGDTFNAGVIHGLTALRTSGKSLDDLSKEDWKSALGAGVEFSGNACQSYDNYISNDFGREVGL